MKIKVFKVAYQIYLTPYVKVTYTRYLNGHLELIIGWINREIVVSI